MSYRIVFIGLLFSCLFLSFPEKIFAKENDILQNDLKKQKELFKQTHSSIRLERKEAKNEEGIRLYSKEEKLDIFYQERLNYWKEKQKIYWNTLPKGIFTINVSAYTASFDECGKSDGITASGIKVQAKRTLACPPMYPFGAKIHIEGMGTYVCEDRGGAIQGNKFDIYMETKNEAFAFGRQNLTAFVLELE